MNQNLYSNFNILHKVEELYFSVRNHGKTPEVILLGSEMYLDFVDHLRAAYQMTSLQLRDISGSYMGMNIYVVRDNPYLVKVV